MGCFLYLQFNLNPFLAGIYIHIPFCRQACHYCDFHFSTNLKPVDDMVACLIKEIDIKGQKSEFSLIETIYFGGGTPSLLSGEHISQLIARIRANFKVSKDPEITLEANPEDIDSIKLAQWQKTGINRLSIGTQSFDNNRLKLMNRNHDAYTAKSAIRLAQNMGIANISADLIFAVPPEDNYFQQDLEEMLELNIPHLSIYGLTIEEKTVFGNWSRKNRIKEISEDLFESQFLLADELLTKAGYQHYEISNFAREGYFSRHNSSYWLQKPFLGIGPGAHSYSENSRSYNLAHNVRYIAAIMEGIIPETIEFLTPIQQLNEYLLTRIRTHYGINFEELKTRFNTDIVVDKNQDIDKWLNSGLAKINKEVLTLTPLGMLLSDEIALILAYDE